MDTVAVKCGGVSQCILHLEMFACEPLLFSAPRSPPHAEQGNYFLGVGIVQNQSSVKPTRANAECAQRLGETLKCMLAVCAHRQLVMVIHGSWNEFVPRQRSRGWGAAAWVKCFHTCCCFLLILGLIDMISNYTTLWFEAWIPSFRLLTILFLSSTQTFKKRCSLHTVIFLLNSSFKIRCKPSCWGFSK